MAQPSPAMSVRLGGYRQKIGLAVVVLGTTYWPTLRANPQPVREAVERAMQGDYAFVTFPRPRLRRRPPPRNGME